MSKFKVAQTVQATRDTKSLLGVRVAKGDIVTVSAGMGTDPEDRFAASHPNVAGTILLLEDDFEAVGSTPDALDSSKVKPGDTVTLDHPDGTHLPNREVNSVYAIKMGKRQEYLSDLYAEGYTLTDHQPAPEPELPTRVGALGRATVTFDGEAHNDVMVILPTPDRLRAPWFLPEGKVNGFDFVSGSHLSKFRPLVVIDPADVDADRVFEAVLPLVDHDLGSGSAYRVKVTVRKVLAHLGIEA